ncbi:MAG: TetR family transcriptional regulator [Chloroflexi bacterium]|nr:TetR family transcriptional regulator [Chloroflexota bacterium]
MAVTQRARSDASKQARRQAILDAAAALFETTPYASIAMQDLADRVGLAKGTLYLSFPSKETLFLVLLQGDLAGWFAAVADRLAALGPTEDAGLVATALTDALLARPALVRLLGLLHGVLEHNVDPAAALNFKRAHLAGLTTTGGSIESVWPGLRPGDGVRLLLRLHALVIGLGELAEPSPAARQALWTPELRPLLVDFGGELTATLVALLRGMAVNRPATSAGA